MNVLVYNGTGSQGRAIVAELLAHGHQVTILTRTPDKATDLAAQGVQVVSGDMADRASLDAANQGIEAVALTITFVIASVEQAFAYARNAIDAARAAGVKLIVFNTSGPVLAELIGNPGYDVRPQVIDYLKASGVPYIILKPTTYLENLLGPWTRQGLAERNVLAYPAGPESRIGWIATADLAALMVAALERPELAPAEWVVSGEEYLSGPELAARFATALGRDIQYEAIPLDVFGAALDELLGPGAGASVLPGYRLLRDHPERLSNWTDMRPVLEKLPVRLTSVIEWVRQFAPLFNGQSEQAQA